MANRSSHNDVFEDIWMNTQVDVLDRPDTAYPDSQEDWEQIEEDNILLNPDAESMDWRG
jgi:hypothetical protein